MILFKVLTKKCVKDSASQFQKFRVNFHKLHAQFSTVRLGYYKFWARWVLKMLTGAHKTQRMASALSFLEQNHEDGDEFLNHIPLVTGYEIWVSFVNVETKD
jgi:hypothetical protein